jgi:hypothetical protein
MRIERLFKFIGVEGRGERESERAREKVCCHSFCWEILEQFLARQRREKVKYTSGGKS